MKKLWLIGVLALALVLTVHVGAAHAAEHAVDCRQAVFNIAVDDDALVGVLQEIEQNQENAFSATQTDVSLFIQARSTDIDVYNAIAPQCRALSVDPRAQVNFPLYIDKSVIDIKSLMAEHHTMMELWYWSA